MEELLKQICISLDIPLFPNVNVMLVDSISEFVIEDDSNYYSERKDSIDKAYGLFYTQTDGSNIILLKNTDSVNLISTLIHEYVHFVDFTNLSAKRQNYNYRELENDYLFLFWTEYHATYLSYKYLIDLAHDSINQSKAANEIVDKLINYFKDREILDKQTTTDITIRSYASYSAIYDSYVEQIDLYPKGYFYNRIFLKIYEFLRNNNEFEKLINKYDEWGRLINSI